MRVLVVGASGTVGKAAVSQLSRRHQIVTAGRSGADVSVDLMNEASVRQMYVGLGTIDAVVACAGHVHFGPVTAMTPVEFRKGLDDKLMGQIHLVLLGLSHISDGGSFTLTSGILDRDPVRAGANAAAVNGAIGAFVRSAAIEMPRGIRINAVSPGLLEESAQKYDGFFPGHQPVSSARVGLAYVKSVEGGLTGQVFLVD
ncbi:short chain dehydrogenase [Aestuariivirga sp.]|jgi:NAD(P)-dependent dehydrogenase (short-subunit alcohol dehydrogenase family)|uniref:short chain dehydrogenase n=1 Tax=Aestuariivirga sp. TaxID=2650926 RepID=UPI0037831F1C